jgi:hypothetical protein
MAVISTGVQKNYNIPGIPFSTVWNGVSRACRLDQFSYSKLANITWTGATYPNIYFYTKSDKNNWAVTTINGWGRGSIYYTTYAANVAKMKLWTPETWRQLAYHEIGHLLLNTFNQDINYPLSATMTKRLVQHWGKPKATEEVNELEVNEVDDSNYQILNDLWIKSLPLWQKVKLWLKKNIIMLPVEDETWMKT